jgi:hypothetical protein
VTQQNKFHFIYKRNTHSKQIVRKASHKQAKELSQYYISLSYMPIYMTVESQQLAALTFQCDSVGSGIY